MEDDEFEWDDDKAASNLAKHGVSFYVASAVFDDPNVVLLGDPTGSLHEARYVALGFSGGRLLTVCYTERGDRLRIISARKASKFEQKTYSAGRP